MMQRHVEIRKDGIFSVQDVFDKPIIQKVMCGWHVLFTDTEGNKRFGYIRTIDMDQHRLTILDAIMYPHGPTPRRAQEEMVPFESVIIASQGFNWLRDQTIYEAGKKVGKRQVAIILQGSECDADVGWIDRKAGRNYVDRQGNQWHIRYVETC